LARKEVWQCQRFDAQERELVAAAFFGRRRSWIPHFTFDCLEGKVSRRQIQIAL
jgi:hypothetical protein